MQPIRPRITNVPGTPGIIVSPRIILSNLITLLVSTNHRPTMLRPIRLDLMSSWFDVATHKILRNDDASRLIGMFDAAKAADFKDPMRMFLEAYAPVIGALMSDPEYVSDAGEELGQRLEETGDWDVMYVTNAAMGYPRKYYQFKYEIGDGVPLFGTTLRELEDLEWVLGKPTNQKDVSKLAAPRLAQAALARLCWLFDRIYMGINLVPEGKNASERDPREPFLGKTQAAMLQARRLTSVPLLYMAQYTALWPRIVSRIDDYATKLAAELYPRDGAALELRGRIKTAALAKIPLHPLMATFASLFESRLTLSTYFGEKDCLLIPNTITLPSGDTATASRSGLAQIAITAALGEQLRLAALTSSSSGTAWVQSIIGDVAPNVLATTAREQGAITLGTGYAALLEMLLRVNKYVDLFPTIEQQLGWSGGKTLTLTSIEAAGADFVLTDGDYYSDSPLMVLAGLRVGLPISNNQVMGFSRRFDAHFNTGVTYGLGVPIPAASDAGLGHTAIVWSTITCQGHRSNSDSDEVYCKFYMPAGMSMGESGGEARWNDANASDPIGKRVASYYTRKSPGGYVRVDALTPTSQQSRSAANLVRYVTDWDTAVESAGDPDAAQSELLATYGTEGVDRSVNLLRYRDSWNTRVPVRLARDNAYIWLNEVGNKIRGMAFDGNVVFDDTLNLTHDVSSIDGLLSLLPVDEPRFSSEIVAEVVSPE